MEAKEQFQILKHIVEKIESVPNRPFSAQLLRFTEWVSLGNISGAWKTLLGGLKDIEDLSGFFFQETGVGLGIYIPDEIEELADYEAYVFFNEVVTTYDEKGRQHNRVPVHLTFGIEKGQKNGTEIVYSKDLKIEEINNYRFGLLHGFCNGYKDGVHRWCFEYSNGNLIKVGEGKLV